MSGYPDSDCRSRGRGGIARVLLRGLMLLVLVSTLGCRDTNRLKVAIALLPSELEAYRSILAAFEEESGHPVVVVPQQYADIRRALAAEAFAGTGTLDLIELDVYALAMSAAHVAHLPASGLPVKPESFLAESLGAGRIDGALRFLPHRISWQALIYDHRVLGKPPATWAELLEVARQHSGKIGFKAARYEGLTCDVLPFVWAAGGSGDDLEDDGARRAFRLFDELAPHLHPHSATFKEATIAEAMARGELVLHLNWPFVMSLYDNQGLAPEPIRSAPLPRGPVTRATVLGGGYLAIPRSAPRPQAARALLGFLLRRDTQQRLRDELGWFSARRDVGMGEADENGLLAGFAAMREYARPRPERADYPHLSRLWQEAFRTVVFRDADPAKTLEDAAWQRSNVD